MNWNALASTLEAAASPPPRHALPLTAHRDMPHAVDPEAQQDDELIGQLLDGVPGSANFLEGITTRDLDVGEKANNAQDFEDIGDDDLADDDLADEPVQANGHSAEDFEDDAAFDDLFGDQPSSPAAADASPEDTTEPAFRDIEYGTEEDPELREQRLLFAQAQRERENRLRGVTQAIDVPAPPQTDAELFERIWPNFDPDEPAPRFGVLLPGKRAFYLAKAPLKQPKPVQPTKVSLDLEQDQERSFKLSTAVAPNRSTRQAEAEHKGLVFIPDSQADQQSSDDDIGLDDGGEFAGVTLEDLAVLCEDWDTRYSGNAPEDVSVNGDTGASWADDDWDHNRDASPIKKRKVGRRGSATALPIYRDALPPLEDPETTTDKLAKHLTLDLNDSQLLIDFHQPRDVQKQARRAGRDFRRDVSGSLKKSILQRYNISNDEAYDLLKENHQHKVRSTLSNITIEHSLPALKLQYPFYKVKLSAREARSFHRPAMAFLPNKVVTFSAPKSVKRKHLKHLDTQNIYRTSHDLSLGDNSNMLLLEYSEEYPIMMSNFGMASKLVNYYRRKDMDDNARPKLDIGETSVLLPQDKSPFSIFGNVEPGQVVPTLHNGMFRAPVFKQDPKPTDFLVMRSTTGVNGSVWHIRTIENIRVVGQEFPSVEVPGTHSRKVTEAAKRRLKMISFRIYSKNNNKNHRGPILSNEMIRQHLPGTDIAQNRGKMREFMAYDKENQSWVPKPGNPVPEEMTMRSWIKPEDICLLDSMQVGHRHLQDAGYNKDEREVDNDEDEDKDGQSIEQQLAPWQTTKNFLNACQGKAMLQLHGEGDPSGRGEAFSFVKTSMKGGFKAIGESVEDKLDAKRLKELGGHSYNVARQQRAYDDAIKRIWEAQRMSLSSAIEHSDTEMDVDAEAEAGGDSSFSHARTPRSEMATPAAGANFHDDAMSQFSRFSGSAAGAHGHGKVLKITRQARDKYGRIETVEEVVRDPKVVREYLKRRRAQELSRITLTDIKPTGDAESDAIAQKMLLEELARLERNKERRHVREKAKGLHGGAATATSPATPVPDGDGAGAVTGGGSTGKAGTQRKCANCGMIGHIKTNKKLCPMLNGTMKRDEGFDDSAFGKE